MAEEGPASDEGSDYDAALRFFFEVGYLKRLPRSGWLLAGATKAESVAEHVFRTAVIGYVLAKLEGADPFRTAVICLFHDLPETRTTDIHPVGKKYIDITTVERKVVSEAYQNVILQIEPLISEYLAAQTREAIVAKDADVLECILQAHEYRAAGFLAAEKFLSGPHRLGLRLVTEGAIQLARRAKHQSPSEWWQALLQTHTPEKHGSDL